MLGPLRYSGRGSLDGPMRAGANPGEFRILGCSSGFELPRLWLTVVQVHSIGHWPGLGTRECSSWLPAGSRYPFDVHHGTPSIWGSTTIPIIGG